MPMGFVCMSEGLHHTLRHDAPAEAFVHLRTANQKRHCKFIWCGKISLLQPLVGATDFDPINSCMGSRMNY